MKTIQILALMLIVSWGAKAQQADQNDSSDVQVSGSVFFGLYKWGPQKDSIENVAFHFKPSFSTSDIETAENDSTEVRSILGGAIKWTERKEQKDVTRKKTSINKQE